MTTTSTFVTAQNMVYGNPSPETGDELADLLKSRSHLKESKHHTFADPCMFDAGYTEEIREIPEEDIIVAFTKTSYDFSIKLENKKNGDYLFFVSNHTGTREYYTGTDDTNYKLTI